VSHLRMVAQEWMAVQMAVRMAVLVVVWVVVRVVVRMVVHGAVWNFLPSMGDHAFGLRAPTSLNLY
jgi:hypothetical protein